MFPLYRCVITVFHQEPSSFQTLICGPFPYMAATLRPFYFIAMNLRKTMYKLQTALNMSGRRVKINQYQSWSDLQKRMVTKFVIIEDGETVLETYQTVEAVKTLANMLGGD